MVFVSEERALFHAPPYLSGCGQSNLAKSWLWYCYLAMADKLSQDLESLKIDRTAKGAGPGSGKWKVISIILFLAVLVIAAISFVPGVPPLSSLTSATVEVEIGTVPFRENPGEKEILTASGYVVPRRRVDVSSKISGRVEDLRVDKGGMVEQGQIMARLDDREIRAQLDQARAGKLAAEARLRELVAGSRPQEVERAKASLDEAEANLRTAGINLERAQKLQKSGVLAKQLLDNAQNAYDVAAAQVEVARENYELARIGPRTEQIDLARAQLAESEAAIQWWDTQLENTLIRAPIGGTILERLIEKGEMVTTGFVSGRGAKSALVSIANLNDLEVELDISEAEIPRVLLGQQCSVSPESYPDRKYVGRVREIAPEANRQKGTIQVKVAILEPDAYLRPETSAKVSFFEERGASPPSALLVPKSALVEGPAIFLVKEGVAHRQPVTTGRERAEKVEVLAGLSGGEQIVVEGAQKLIGGERVISK
jgi:HlyD family secretion protein